MDYSVGSLSDLITGSITPNKPKVVKKQVVSLPQNETPTADEDAISPRKIKTKQIKRVKADSTVKTVKKRKLSNTDEGVPEPKKSKNVENTERRLANKNPVRQEESPEILARTIFVGNLPVTLGPKKLKKIFKKYGNIESSRLRGISVADPKVPKKVAIIKKGLHPDRSSFHGYIRFEKREDAMKATEMNGTIYKDHHLRVRLCDAKERPDESKAIFIGNLSFYAEEDDLWKLFEGCGPVESVRIIRDAKTGMGKGFGYVNFQNSDSVALALEMENVRLKDRELRISICNLNTAKKNRKNNKVKKITKPGKPKSFKGHKHGKNVHEAHTEDTQLSTKRKENQFEEFERIKNKSFQGARFALKKKENQFEENGIKVNANQGFKNKSFQGAKFAPKKKKSKPNKGLLKRKKMVEKVAPK